MTEGTAVLCCLWFVIAFTEVACWTVDLDEVRQFLDHQKEHEDYHQLHYHNDYDESDEYDSFSEVPQQRGHHYAQQYGYEGYMEKKVHDYFYKGSEYLEGLRVSLENYKRLLENCSVYNFTEFDNLNASLLPDVRWNETADVWNWNWAQGERRLQWPQLLNITGALNNTRNTTPGFVENATQGFTQGVAQPATLANATEGLLDMRAMRARCQKATREREHVRRLADLALFTARQLQNWATHEKQYDKSAAHGHDERALITRLAYLLDKLAELTGYTPDIKVFSKQQDRKTTTTTTTTASPLAAQLPEELRQLLLSCMRQQAAPGAEAVPATERCRAPPLLPPLLLRMLNMTYNNMTSVSPTAPAPPAASSALTTTPPPLPIDPELRQARVLTNYLVSNVWGNQPRRKRKRSVHEPLMKMVEYYTKHKAWSGANELVADKHQQLHVENYITRQKSMEDRADFFKRNLVFSFLYPFKSTRGFRRPKIPNLKHGDKLSKYLEKLRGSAAAGDVVRRVNLPPRNLQSKQKRSVIIQQSEDPMKDISYYVKNKPGTNIRPSLVDAVRVRASLERIFNRGNIAVVHRYGANYNPLVPSPFVFGVIKTLSDI